MLLIFINSGLLWTNNLDELDSIVQLNIRLGYQSGIIWFSNQESIKKFNQTVYGRNKYPAPQFPISIDYISQLKNDNVNFPLFPGIIIIPKNQSNLKQQLSKYSNTKLLIGVKTKDKGILEVAARDGRVDALILSDGEYIQSLTKGILSLAKQNKVHIILTLSPIFNQSPHNRIKFLKQLRKMMLMAKPINTKYNLGFLTNDKRLFIGPQESISILSSIVNIPYQFGKFMVREQGESLVLRFLKRYFNLFIEDGVEIVDIKKNNQE